MVLERWRRVRELFDAAIELPLDERLAYLEKATAEDDHWVGRRFGPYESAREIGRGGMGVVLLGDRADGRYKRRVAIKVLHTALMQGELVERFRSEGQILADLDHPNIARIERWT